VQLVADRRSILSDGRDLAVLRAQIVDRRGIVVPDSDALVRFELAGPGRVIGVGNGNPTSLEPDQARQRRAYHGLCQALVQSTGRLGPIKLRATADGLQAGTLALLAAPVLA
jgi:beta-galactosidase